jgi:DMSO/TMAO reductase YedYZ molybdopterin-dependent catalytic subunit
VDPEIFFWVDVETTMNNRKHYAVALSIIAIQLACVLGCQPALTAGTKQLESVEVKEYKGEKLGSLADFHENSIAGPQFVDIAKYKLNMTGLVESPISYTYDDVISKHQSYAKLLTIDCVEGWSVKILWEGIQIKDLLKEAGIKPSAKVVIFHAYDTYTTSMPVQYILDNNILLAYKMNGVTLPPERGYPFELVAEDKWGYKWIKWVTEIQLSDNQEFKGHWETLGYSNDGSREKPFFDQ